jgi:hypothetical protein
LRTSGSSPSPPRLTVRIGRSVATKHLCCDSRRLHKQRPCCWGFLASFCSIPPRPPVTSWKRPEKLVALWACGRARRLRVPLESPGPPRRKSWPIRAEPVTST